MTIDEGRKPEGAPERSPKRRRRNGCRLFKYFPRVRVANQQNKCQPTNTFDFAPAPIKYRFLPYGSHGAPRRTGNQTGD
jgi:hypothetical protein